MTDYVRLTDILSSFWDGVEKTDSVPLEADIDPDKLDLVWGDCYLVHVLKGEPYKYDYLGQNLIVAYGEKVSRSEVETLVYPSIKKIAKNFSKVIEGRKPLEESGEFINSNNMLIRYRQLMLPFGDASGKITHILGGMRWVAV